MASRSAATRWSGCVLERGRLGGVGISELVGGAAGDGRWRFLREAPNDLAARQLEPARPHGEHRSAATAEVGGARAVDGLHPDRRHPRNGHHREWSQPLAGGGPAADPALGTGETLCGAASRQPVCPLDTDEHRSKVALAGELRGVAVADLETAQSLHRCTDGLNPLDGGSGCWAALAQPAGNGLCRRSAWHRQHPDQ